MPRCTQATWAVVQSGDCADGPPGPHCVRSRDTVNAQQSRGFEGEGSSRSVSRPFSCIISSMNPDDLRPPPLNEQQFLRVGDWHKSETSHNYATGEQEMGVSAYELHEGKPVVPPDDDDAESNMHMRLASDEPKHLVTGKVVAWGGEGEPLLKDLKRVGEYHHER